MPYSALAQYTVLIHLITVSHSIFLLFGLFMLLCVSPTLHNIYFIRLCLYVLNRTLQDVQFTIITIITGSLNRADFYET